MSDTETTKVQFGSAELQPDDVLAALEAAQAGPFENAAASPGLEGAGTDESPFDVRVARPRVLSITKLYGLADKPVPADLQATLGNTVPLLLVHGVTPFHRPGASRKGVWGLGYEVVLRHDTEERDLDADTVSVEPGTQFLEVGQINQKISVGLSAGGSLGASQETADAGSALGIAIPNAAIHATTDQRFALAIHFVLRLLKVQAGRFGTGGAKWNIYNQDDPVDGEHTLLQTITVDPSVTKFRTRIVTWVRKRGFLGGSFGGKTWTAEPVTYDISLLP
jgi:hypothetical protein